MNIEELISYIDINRIRKRNDSRLYLFKSIFANLDFLTLKRNGLSAEAAEMTEKVFNSGSYEEALNIIGEYVNITSVDEPGDNMGMSLK